MPCLLAAYTGLWLKPLSPAPDESLTMTPLPCCEHLGNLVFHTEPNTFELGINEANSNFLGDLMQSLWKS